MNHDDSTTGPGSQAAYLRALEADLQLARALQQSLLPQQYPSFPSWVAPEESALRFHHRYHAAEALSGDFFSVQRISDTSAGVLICDVMGHGVRPAMFTAVLRSMIEEFAPLAGNPDQFLSNINYRLIDLLQRAGMTFFATALYMVIDAASGELRYSNAGHPVPLHVQREANLVAPLPQAGSCSGPALGVFEGAVYPVLQCNLSVNDVIVLFTDGLVEAKGLDAKAPCDADPEDYGEERLRTTLGHCLQFSTPALLEDIISAQQQFCGTRELEDDLCIVALEVCKIGEIAPPLRDDPTGLFNRRYLEESLARELHRAQRNSYPLGIIILAFEDFEKWSLENQDTSSLLLRRVGEFLLRRTRGSDIACHNNNAKFVLVLPEASLENASRKAEQLHESLKQIASELFIQNNGSLRVSKGVAAFPDHGATGEAVLEAASAFLNQAN